MPYTQPRTIHVARVREQIGRAPQQLDARLRHQLLGQRRHLVQIGVRLGDGGALGRNVAVVKGPVLDAQLRQRAAG
jgi:hypothetical protein